MGTDIPKENQSSLQPYMNFYKSSIYTFSYTLLFQVYGLVITKVTAVKFGPSGSAIIGDYNNILGVLGTFTFLSIASGIVKYVSEYQQDKEMLYKVLNTAFSMILSGSVLVGIFSIFFSNFLSINKFGTSAYQDTFVFYGISVFFFALQNLISGYLNGTGQIKILSAVNLITGIVHLATILTLIHFIGIKGAMIVNVLTGILVTLIGSFFIIHSKQVDWSSIRIKIDRPIAWQLLKYGLIASVTTFFTSLVLISIRGQINSLSSSVEAGCWSAMNSLTDRMNNLLFSSVIVYYIPKLSSLIAPDSLVTEMLKAFKRILPLTFVLVFGVWLCKDLIIKILLDDEFVPMRDLFLFQMLGLFFKAGAMLFSFLAISKAMLKTALIVELLYAATMWVTHFICIKEFGWIGASYGFAIANLLYFLYYIISFRNMVVLIKKKLAPNPWLK